MRPLLGFIAAARAGGVRISTSETLDALRAVEIVGVRERATMRDALTVVLAKSMPEKALLQTCFDLYFGTPSASEGDDGDGARGDGGESAAANGDAGRGSGARTELDAAIERAAGETDLARIRYPTQRNQAVRRIVEMLEAQARENGEDDAADAAAVRNRARERVDRALALAAPANERDRDRVLSETALWNLDRRDVERVRAIARAMAERLATRFGRSLRRARRGRLDVRRTLRRNVGHGGVPFTLAYKRKHIERPRLFVLCDVSGSVAALASFLLLVVYGLHDAIAGVRSFAFTGRLTEITALLAAEPIETAVPRVMRELGFGSSDYGGTLVDFARGPLADLDRRTTIIILGDARTNGSDPRTDILRTMHDRAGRIVWLNPEHRGAWGTGDSEMRRYLPFIDDARVCATLGDLEAAVAALLLPR